MMLESKSASTHAFFKGYKEFERAFAALKLLLDEEELSDEDYYKGYHEAKRNALHAAFLVARSAGYKKFKDIFDSECLDIFEDEDPWEGTLIKEAIDDYEKKYHELREYLDEDKDEDDEYGKAKKKAWRVDFEKARTKGYLRSETLFNIFCDSRWDKQLLAYRHVFDDKW